MSPFDVWLVILGLAIGAGLAWLVMLDLRRHDDDIAAAEARAEAAWIADALGSRGIAADAEAVEEVLRFHRAYLAGIPDDGALRATPAPDVLDATADAYDDEVAPVAVAAPPSPPRPARPAPPAPLGPTPVATTAVAAPLAAPAPAAAGFRAAPVDHDAEEPKRDALEPAWADDDLAAAHDALDTLLRKPPPEN